MLSGIIFKRCVIFFLFLSLSPLVLANESANKEMVCLTTHYPPFTIFREEQRDFVGRDMVYLNQLARRLNWKLTVLNFPWGRVKQEIEKNQFDCFFSLAYNEDRAQFLNYTQYPLHITQYGVFFQKHNTQVEQKKLANKIVGVLRGIPLEETVLNQHELAQANIVYLDSNETLLTILMTGRVDASILNYEVGHFLLEDTPHKADIDSFVVAEHALPVFLAFRKGTQDINLINAALREVMGGFQKDKPSQ